jgi:hypothetical protein
MLKQAAGVVVTIQRESFHLTAPAITTPIATSPVKARPNTFQPLCFCLKSLYAFIG